MPKTKDAFALRDIVKASDIDKLNSINLQGIFLKSEKAYSAIRKWINAESCQVLVMRGFESEVNAVHNDITKLTTKMNRVDAHILQLQDYLERIVDRLISVDDNGAVKARAARTKQYLNNYKWILNVIIACIEDLFDSLEYYRNRLPAEFKKDFGGRLKLARERKGLTVDKVAEMLNLSYNGYSQYERGIREPSLLTLRRLSKILDVSADWLLGIEK